MTYECQCDWLTGECQAPPKCRAVEDALRLRAALHEIERLREQLRIMTGGADYWKEIERLREAIIQVRGFAHLMAENNWRDMQLYIERQCDVLPVNPH